MATKALTFTQDEINTLSPNGTDISKVMHAISVAGSSESCDSDVTEAKAVLIAHRDEIAEIWEKYKVLEKLLKNFKEAVEGSLIRFTDEEGNIGGFEKQFKWQKGATKILVADMPALLQVAEGNGLSIEEIGAYVNSITAKDAAKMLGMSDDAFMNNYGELVVTKTNRPTLKGI